MVRSFTRCSRCWVRLRTADTSKTTNTEIPVCTPRFQNRTPSCELRMASSTNAASELARAMRMPALRLPLQAAKAAINR